MTAHFAASPEQFRWLDEVHVSGFIRDPEVHEQFVPLLVRQFEDQPSSVGPFLQLNADLIPAVLAATDGAGQLRTFPAPVRVAFGEDDTYVTPPTGSASPRCAPTARQTPISGAAHFPRVDAPADVARTILDAPTTPQRR